MYNKIVGEATYMLRSVLNDKNISLYQLEKASHISHATLNDIYNERSNIDNCSILVMSKIAASLNMDIDDLYKKLTYRDLSLFTYNEDFDLFKSDTLQRLKREKEEDFIKRMATTDVINNYYQNNKYKEALYLLALLDYLSKKNSLPLLKQYDYLRDYKLDKVYVSKSLYLLLAYKSTTVTSIYKECIKEFLKYNIVEAEIDNTYIYITGDD